MYVKFGNMLVPLTKVNAEDGVETWITEAACPGCHQSFNGLIVVDDEQAKVRSRALDTKRLTCINCGAQFYPMVPEGNHGAMIPAGEGEVRDLHKELTFLEARRKVITQRLAEISRQHIEVQRAEYAAELEGDAQLFSAMTKARLMQIIEDHWSIHHMGAVQHFEGLTKADLVNMVISIKGLDGHYEKPPPRVKPASTGARAGRRSALRF